ncbi:hypothetical protein J8801_27155, partial [Klebsiella pneumoniae]
MSPVTGRVRPLTRSTAPRPEGGPPFPRGQPGHPSWHAPRARGSDVSSWGAVGGGGGVGGIRP